MSRKSTRLQEKHDCTQGNLPSIISRKRKVEPIQGKDDHGKRQRREVTPKPDEQTEVCLLQPIEMYSDSSAACNQLTMSKTSPAPKTSHSAIFWKRFNSPQEDDTSGRSECDVEAMSWSSVEAWIDPEDILKELVLKDTAYQRDCDIFSRHPTLQPRVRAIVLDWLIEVCEVYRLHRNTYYLALDFLDRFLSYHSNILKQQLQLIGITALFIAAKLEEIYPPKLAEFAFVTDGACTEAEILVQELVMLKALNWDLNPVTVNICLNVYMQLWNYDRENSENFLIPHISGNLFMQAAQLLDLCTLDCGSLTFSYRVLAAAAIYHMISQQMALTISRLDEAEIENCVSWMLPFALTVREHLGPKLKFFPHVDSDDAYNIQVHLIDLQMLERAQERQVSCTVDICSTPSTSFMAMTLTPPNSREKPTL